MNHDPQNNKVCWDNFGMCASCLCAVHCAAVPLVLALMPSLAVTWLHGPLVHSLLALAVVTFCVLGPLPGYLQHRNRWILAGTLTGLLLVLFATFAADPLLGEAFEVPVITVGNAVLIATHFCNRKILRCLKHDKCFSAATQCRYQLRGE